MSSSLSPHISSRSPMIVVYHPLALVLTLDCYQGNCHLSDSQSPSPYAVDFLDFSVSGKIVSDEIVELNSEERVTILTRGWTYVYNSRPLKYWDASLVSPTTTPPLRDSSKLSTHDLIELIKKENPLAVKIYIGKLIRDNRIKKGDPFVLTHHDYLHIYTTSHEQNHTYYPLCNDQHLEAQNYSNWVYYTDYRCWIDTMGERCCCVDCYSLPFREVTDYSFIQLQNSHCYLCSCKSCICANTQSLKSVTEPPLPSCLQCDICKQTAEITDI